MKVAVLGTGHIGLVTCVSLATIGHDVVGHDVDHEKLEALQRGRCPFYEPGVKEALQAAVDSGRLGFSKDVAETVAEAEVIFICVGTPSRANGEANLIAVERATRDAARSASPGAVIVEKSTVPAGTADRIRVALRDERPDIAASMEVVSNPEFLREGRALQDALAPDRILVGSDSERGFEVMRRLYRPLVERGHPLIETDIATAELAKHACNAFLALKISYVNALARLCERADADVEAIAEVMGSDPRIGNSFLRAGIGYGGYCFPKDLVAFERLAERLGYRFPLLAEVARINAEAVEAAVDKVRDALWNLEGKRVAILGLAFKPGTDDTRFSPALALARRLLEEGAEVVGYDPQASANAKSDLSELEIALDPYEACRGSHCAVLSTEWDELRELDLARVKEVMLYPILIDGRNALDAQAAARAGIDYRPTGRRQTPAPMPETTGA